MARTNQDQRHLACLRDFYARERALPMSLAEMSSLLGFRSPAAAAKLCARLTSAGFLRRSGTKSVPADRFFEVPFTSSSVRAGAPQQVDEASVELVSLDSLVIAKPSATFLLPIKGDSMEDAGIYDGDVAVVERTSAVEVGQFVVAMVDGEFTLKELGEAGGIPVLIAHNSAYAPIKAQEHLEIVGLVRGILRTYTRKH